TDRGTPSGFPGPLRPDPPGAVALVDAAVAVQLGQAPLPAATADLAAADRFVAAVLERFREAGA
ncbi:MAG TPA: hypothetical protein VG411_01210, partial [Actinomycetota bacterium]|nr:hypothetical protein [Actinomycetota bacterium]